MKIVLTNDDGHDAVGIQALIRILQKDHELFMLAPKTHQSAKSQAVSPSKEISFEQSIYQHCKGFIIDGTPADCMLVGLKLLKDEQIIPDLIISGINVGANLGRDMHRSGTFGAAREGAMQGIPAIALSNVDYSETVESVVERLGKYVELLILQIEFLKENKLILNGNFPRGKIQGMKVCEADAIEFYQLEVSVDQTRKSAKFQGSEAKGSEGTDIYWCERGFATLTYSKCDVCVVPQVPSCFLELK